MAFGKTARYLRNNPNQPGTHFILLILLGIACGMCLYFLVSCIYFFFLRYDDYVSVEWLFGELYPYIQFTQLFLSRFPGNKLACRGFSFSKDSNLFLLDGGVD